MTAIRVSALVTTYNAERFLRGRLQDLTSQTLWETGGLEIVVVNSGSKQAEHEQILDFMQKLPPAAPFQYIRTAFREPMYTAWNRAIRVARGAYLTSANTDDRLRPDALELLANALDAAPPDVVGVYGDCYVTSTANAVWGGEYVLDKPSYYPSGCTDWPLATAREMAQRCVVGPCPVWRRNAHVTAGLFDESFVLAGDYEMWLRFMAAGMGWRKVNEVVGLFYHHPDQQSQANIPHIVYETRRAQLLHAAAVLEGE